MEWDVSKHYGGSIEGATAAVKAKVLVIVAREDHAATPEPAIEFAHLLHADLVVLDDGCGHQYCDYACCENGGGISGEVPSVNCQLLLTPDFNSYMPSTSFV